MTEREDFARRYIDELRRVLADLPFSDLARAMEVLDGAWAEGRQVFIAGNGGSAATASHMANDLLWGMAQIGRPGFRVISLSDGIATLTAIANDRSYDDVFAVQLETRSEAGDVLVVISGSGNSRNIVKAVETAASRGLATVGFLGKVGGAVSEMVDVPVVVPSDDYGPIEDVHMAFDHLLIAWFRQRAGAVRESSGNVA